MRIVAQAQTAEQMFMALDKFKAAVLIVAGGFIADFNSVVAATAAAQDAPDYAGGYRRGGVEVYWRGRSRRNLPQRHEFSAGRLRPQSGSRRELDSGHCRAQRVDRERYGRHARSRSPDSEELRIVALIVQGYKNKEIATQLGTTEQVIKNYLRNVYDKIGVSDRLELALFTIHHRILAEAAAATTGTSAPAPQKHGA